MNLLLAFFWATLAILDLATCERRNAFILGGLLWVPAITRAVRGDLNWSIGMGMFAILVRLLEPRFRDYIESRQTGPKETKGSEVAPVDESIQKCQD